MLLLHASIFGVREIIQLLQAPLVYRKLAHGMFLSMLSYGHVYFQTESALLSDDIVDEESPSLSLPGCTTDLDVLTTEEAHSI